MRILLTLTLFMIIAISSSCEKEKEDFRPIKPTGKYITNILKCNPSESSEDTLKFASYQYDEKRYLNQIDYYDPKTQDISLKIKFDYNSDGKLRQIAYYNSGDTLERKEIINYEYLTINRDEFFLVDGILTLKYRNRVILDAWDRPVRQYLSYTEENNIITSASITANYSYNTDGDLISNIFNDTFSESKFRFEFDDKVNPFHNAGFDIVHQFSYIPWKYYISFIPVQNLTASEVAPYGTYDRYTTYIQYDNDYPVSEKITSFMEFLYFYSDL